MAAGIRTRKLRAGALVGLGVGAVAASVVLGHARFLEGVELDWFSSRAGQAARSHPAGRDIEIVAIDDEALAYAGDTYPMPRGAMADLLRAVREAGARTIAIDLIFGADEQAMIEENLDLATEIGRGGVAIGAAASGGGASTFVSALPWAALAGAFADEGGAAADARGHVRTGIPVALPAAGKVELWYAGFRSRDEVAKAFPGAGAFRELSPAELARGSVLDAPVRQRHAKDLGGAAAGGGDFAVVSPDTRFALAADALGVVSQLPEPDGRIYRLRHVFHAAEGDYLSLPLAAAWLYRDRPPLRVTQGALSFGGARVPLDASGRTYLRWYGFPRGHEHDTAPYATVSAKVLLEHRYYHSDDPAKDPPLPPEMAALRGKLALITPFAAAAKDQRPTPVNPSGKGGEIVANAVDNLLRGEFTRRLPPWGEALIAFFAALASALAVMGLSLTTPRVSRALAMTALFAVVSGTAWWTLTRFLIGRGLWLPAAGPLAGGTFAMLAAAFVNYGIEQADRSFVQNALGRYTSKAVVQKLLSNRALLDQFGGARQDLTVYFSDVRGFTTISEGMEAERLVELLNEYLSSLSELIEQRGGYIDKYIGDAIMAFWGAPVPAADHAVRACQTALAMRDRLAELRPVWKERFGVELHARAGVNTGPMVVGNIGSRAKTNYTVLGDSVNLASRLEGANKAYSTEILLGAGTYEAARDAIHARLVDVVRVKGKHVGVRIYELAALKGALPPERVAWLARWDEAMAAYHARRFGDARAAFEALERERPGDGPAHVYLERCAQYLAFPPPENWDGIYEMHEK